MKPETMMIDEIKYVRADSIAPQTFEPVLTGDFIPWEIGAIYLIRTVTMIDTGKIVAVYPTEIVLEDAAWIPDTGRFSESLIKCNFTEVEPFPDGQVILGRGSIIEAVRIKESPRKESSGIGVVA